jgi:hypothetical protein
MNRLFAVLLAVTVVVGPALGQPVTYTKIVDLTTPAPGGGTFTSFAFFPNIDGSTVAFYGTVAGASSIYTGNGGAISTLVPAGAANPNGGTFTSLNQSFRFDGGSAVFVGTGGTSSPGLFTSNGTTITRLADAATPIPGGTGNFTTFGAFPSLSGGTGAFRGQGSASQEGIYTAIGGTPPSVTLVADKNTAVPNGTSGNFTDFGTNPSISGTTVAFRAGSSLGANSGVYAKTGAGPLTTVAEVGMPLPGGVGTFSGLFSEPAVSGDNVSFIVSNGVYARLNGTLTTIADTSTAAPNGGTFTTITTYAPISGDAIAFIGTTSNGVRGIYAYSGGALQTLVDTSTGTFDGRTLATTPFFLGIDAIDGNTVTFTAAFTTGGNGIYTATFTPVPEPSTVALAGVAGLGLVCRWRRKRR